MCYNRGMTYKQAMKFLSGAEKNRLPPTLARMTALCRALGDPQKRTRFVHIAGTNGKGSCAAMLESIFRRAGYRTGLFTSPHLVDFSERIRVNGVNITNDEIALLTDRLEAAAATVPPLGFFELVTALAFLHFAEEGCDAVILECGLGGRFDATNVIDRPEMSVIMPISLDHTALLGDTLPLIAAEKAGIIKPGCPVVSARQEPQALAVIRRRCEELGAPLYEVDINSISPAADSSCDSEFLYRGLSLHTALRGAHQRENAAAAVECALRLGVPSEAIRAGLAGARWPCRFELLRDRPPLIVDGAHNPHGAAALAAALRQDFPDERFCFIIGVMADKDYGGIIAALESVAAQFLCVTPDSPRALDAAALAAHIGPLARVCRSSAEALDAAQKSGLPCCVCGSLYLAGELQAQIKPLL